MNSIYIRIVGVVDTGLFGDILVVGSGHVGVLQHGHDVLDGVFWGVGGRHV